MSKDKLIAFLISILVALGGGHAVRTYEGPAAKPAEPEAAVVVVDEEKTESLEDRVAKAMKDGPTARAYAGIYEAMAFLAGTNTASPHKLFEQFRKARVDLGIPENPELKPIHGELFRPFESEKVWTDALRTNVSDAAMKMSQACEKAAK